MTRHDLIRPVPLRPANVQKSLFPIVEERKPLEKVILPPIREGSIRARKGQPKLYVTIKG